MTMEISRLGIEVTSTGIKEASAALGGLSTAANNADKRVASLTTNLGNLMRVSGSTIGNVSGLTGSMALINNALTSAATNAAALAQALGQSAQGMNNMAGAANNSSRALQRKAYHGGVVVTTLKAMTTAALAYFSVRTASGIVEQADAWGMMQAKLKLAVGSMEEAKRIQNELFVMSQNMRTPLQDMGTLYTRLQPALTRMGKTSGDVKNMVEGVSLALKLQGATGAEAASTMLQFSQAANAGRLNGAEFNSVAENGVLILRALEDYLGKNQAELKKMGAEGKLTFDIISAALENKLPQWRKDFDSLPLTFEGAMQRLKNAWFKAVGEMGQDNELGKRMAEIIGQLERDMPRIAETVISAMSSLITVLQFVIENAKTIGSVLSGILAIGVAKWAMEGALAFIKIADALGVAGMAAAGARAALSFMGGPIGIVTGLLTAGVIAWNLWSETAVKQSDFATVNTNKDTDSRIKHIQEEIAFLNKRNEAAGAMPAAAEGFSPQTQAKFDAAVAKRKLLAEQTLPAVRQALQLEVDQAEAAFQNSLAIDMTLKGLKEAVALKTKLAKQDADRKEFNKHFATPKEKAELEIKDWKEKLGDSFTEADAAKIREKHLHTAAKAAKEVSKAVKEANDELTKSIDLNREAKAAYADYISTGGEDDKRTKAERELGKLERELAAAKDVTAKLALKKAIALAQEAASYEVQLQAAKDAKAVEDGYSKERRDANKSAEDELRVIRDKIAAFGQAKGAVESLTLAQAQNTLEIMKSVPNNQIAIAEQERLIATLKKVQSAKAELGQLELGEKLEHELDALKPADFGNGFESAFGKIGKSIDKAGKSLDQYNKKMNHLQKLRDEAANVTDETKRNNILTRLANEEQRAEMDKYADMAGAVKGFFKEKTLAYKVFDAFEKGIRMAQMAMTMQEMLTKVAADKTVLASKATTTAAGTAIEAGATTASVGFSLTRMAASTAAGVAKLFEQLGVGGFVAAGAFLALMASLGGGSGGGTAGGGLIGPDGKVETLEQRQARNGTGTVLGDDTAKSESIVNALERMRDNSNIGLTYTSGMLASLRNIEANIGGLTASIARVSGITTGKNFGIDTGTRSSGIKGLFGKQVTTDILDTGLTLNGTLGSLLTQQYLDIQETTKKSGFLGIGGSTKTRNSRRYQGVDDEVTQNISAIFADIGDSIIDASVSLGGNATAMREQLKNFAISTEVSFKDLKGDELEKALDAMFSATADRMAKTMFPDVESFQQAGEGYFETLTRVASGTERAQNALKGLGIAMIDLQSLSQKQGEIDTELVRESLMRAEAGTSLTEILKVMDGSMEDLVDGYKELARLRNAMTASGLGSNLTLALIRGAGGLSELSSAMDDYFDGFFSDEEKSKVGMSKLRMEFARLNTTLPASKEAFKALVTGLMAGDEASQELAGRILALSGDFAEAMDLFSDTRKEKIDAAKDALSDAYDKEAEALENIRDKMKDFASSLKDFRDGLLMGDLSTKSVMEKYQTALLNYNDVSAKALSGDVDAISQFQKVAEELLGLSRQVNASGSGYTADYDRVLAETEALRQFTEGQADTATQNLTLLQRQVDGLIEINESVKTVAQAIQDLQAAMAITVLNGAVVDGSHADGLSSVPFDGYVAELHKGERVLTAGESKQYMQAGTNANEALCEEIKSLKAEVARLREDQARQTDALVTSNYDAAQRNADAIVDGTKEAAADAAYSQRSGINLN